MFLGGYIRGALVENGLIKYFDLVQCIIMRQVCLCIPPQVIPFLAIDYHQNKVFVSSFRRWERFLEHKLSHSQHAYIR